MTSPSVVNKSERMITEYSEAGNEDEGEDEGEDDIELQ